MNLYTSYWAQVRNFPKNLVGLNTTVWPPKWRPLGKDKRGVIIVDCPPFKPGEKCEGLCNGRCSIKRPDKCAFLQTYYQQLEDEITPNIFTSINNLAEKIKKGENLDDIDFAFIVFETPSNPCSERIAIQKWFNSHNIPIEEWKPNI